MLPRLTVAAHRNAPDSKTLPDGLEQVCEPYREELRQFFTYNSRRADAVDDLVQIVYLRLLRSRPTEPVIDPRQYMWRVAWNELRRENERRQREQQRAVSCDPAELTQLSDYVDSLWTDNSTEDIEWEQVNQALRELPIACQIAFLRQYRDGKTYKEIAEELKVTPHAVKKYIVKALGHFRAHFATVDMEPE